MAEAIWDLDGFQILRREAEGGDKFRYEYAASHGGFVQVWTDNPQEFGVYGRSIISPEHWAEFTMFIKNERYFNHYGVRP